MDHLLCINYWFKGLKIFKNKFYQVSGKVHGNAMIADFYTQKNIRLNEKKFGLNQP